jgi:UDP-GlcNAc3NAcA epimerase
MRILTVVGARPQFIKAAVVSRVLARLPGVTEVLVHTGQHYDAAMSDVFFTELEMAVPNVFLGIGSASHGAQTGRMLEAVETVIRRERPDWVLVYGDTNSTLAGALAAAKLHVPVAHVEAGLRSHNRRMPEEINRVLTDHAADLLLAPTAAAVENLRLEGLPPARVRQVGDVMCDAARHFGAIAAERSRVLDQLGLAPKSYALATLHRAENTDDLARLRVLVDALMRVSAELPVVWPVHPRTRHVLDAEGWLGVVGERLRLIPPQGYMDMALLSQQARVIATDSGGLQKEAFFYGVPGVVLKEESEWHELLSLGWNRLAPPVSAEAVAAVILSQAASPGGEPASPYGDGHAAEAVAEALLAGAMTPR